MNIFKKVFNSAKLLILLGLTQNTAIASTSVFDNTTQPITGFVRISPLFTDANKITPSSDVKINDIKIQVGDFSGGDLQTLKFELCPDQSGSPSNICSEFISQYSPTAFSLPGQYRYYTVNFSGSYTATANEPFWVKLSSTTTGLYTRYTSGSNGYVNSGLGYVSQNYSFHMAVTGGPVTAAVPTVTQQIPTISSKGTLLLVLLITIIAFIHAKRKIPGLQ